jgi:hypothetical protein
MVLNLPLMSALTTPTRKKQERKENEKKRTKRKLQQAIESQTKAKSKIT